MINDVVSSLLYKNLKDIFEFGSFVVSIIGIVAIFISIKQLKSEQKRFNDDQKDKENEIQYKQKEKSIEILAFFANDLIPQIDDYIGKINEEIVKSGVLNERDIEKRDMIILTVRKKCGAGYIFNQLEHVCLNICSELADEDMIYYPLHRIIVEFVDDNKEVYDDLLKEVPYKYLSEIYDRWTNKEKLNKLEKESERIESEKNKIQSKLEKKV